MMCAAAEQAFPRETVVMQPDWKVMPRGAHVLGSFRDFHTAVGVRDADAVVVTMRLVCDRRVRAVRPRRSIDS